MSMLALDGVLPRSRRTDPVTSLDAGRAHDLAPSQQQVLELFAEAGRPLADHELVAAARAAHAPFSPQRIRTARSELAELGQLVLVEGEYRSTPARYRARVWALPFKLMDWQRSMLSDHDIDPDWAERLLAAQSADEGVKAHGDPTLGGDGLLLAIDADCPHCGWPERTYDTRTRRFGCIKCTYTSDERNA